MSTLQLHSLRRLAEASLSVEEPKLLKFRASFNCQCVVSLRSSLYIVRAPRPTRNRLRFSPSSRTHFSFLVFDKFARDYLADFCRLLYISIDSQLRGSLVSLVLEQSPGGYRVFCLVQCINWVKGQESRRHTAYLRYCPARKFLYTIIQSLVYFRCFDLWIAGTDVNAPKLADYLRSPFDLAAFGPRLFLGAALSSREIAQNLWAPLRSLFSAFRSLSRHADLLTSSQTCASDVVMCFGLTVLTLSSMKGFCAVCWLKFKVGWSRYFQ